MLAKDFDKGLNIFSGEMFSHEGLITEMHFLKLQILAQLYKLSKVKV